jgi:hypothetical protein
MTTLIATTATMTVTMRPLRAHRPACARGAALIVLGLLSVFIRYPARARRTLKNSNAMRVSTALLCAAAAAAAAPARSEIDLLILLDPGVELVTPQVLPLNGEAQLQEMLGIQHLTVEVDTAKVADEPPPPPPGAPKPPPLPPRITVHLNSNDKLYREVRDAGVYAAGEHLKERAKEMQAFQDDIRKRGGGGGGGGGGSSDVEFLKRTVKALPKLQEEKRSLRLLLGLLEPIQEEFRSEAVVGRWRAESDLLTAEDAKEAFKGAWEECSRQLAGCAPLAQALRMLCLASVVGGGLRWKDYDAAWREVVAFYGPPAAFTLVALERAGLLTYRGGEGGVASMLGVAGPAASNGVWEKVSRALGLVAEVKSEEGGPPKDLHYTTMGYAPLSVRLCQAAAWLRRGARLVPDLRRDGGRFAVVPAAEILLQPDVGNDEEIPAAHLADLELGHARAAVPPGDRDHRP